MSATTKRKAIVGSVITGALSIALYVLLFANEDLVNSNFGKGGLYALLPIATAFLFSFVHGTFTGNFWSAVGIEAAKGKGGK